MTSSSVKCKCQARSSYYIIRGHGLERRKRRRRAKQKKVIFLCSYYALLRLLLARVSNVRVLHSKGIDGWIDACHVHINVGLTFKK